jgi:hypothetical protein
MALDAAAAAFGHLMLGDGGEEAGSWPTLLVGPFSKLRPQGLDGGQPKLVEQQAEACGVDRAHATSPIWPAPMRHS